MALPVVDPVALSQFQAALEVQRQNNWILKIYGLVDPVKALELSIMQGFGLSEESDEIVNPYMNIETYFAGRARWSGGSVTWKDTIDVPTAEVLKNWRRQVYQPLTGMVGRSYLYKKMATLTLFSSDYIAMRTWKIFGIWPKEVTWQDDLNMGSSNMVIITASMRFDRAVEENLIASFLPTS